MQGYAADQGANQRPEVPRAPVTRFPNPQEDSEQAAQPPEGSRGRNEDWQLWTGKDALETGQEG